VAVAGDGKIATCSGTPTGMWTSRTSSFAATDTLRGAAYSNGYWVCVGWSATHTGKLATAKPGV